MREIEFRGLSNGSWVYGVYVDSYMIDGVVEANDEYITIESWIPVNKNTISQYTGLEDVNRVPIYEGDIVEIDGIYNSVVEFFKGGFVLRINGEIYPLRLFFKKVVGNIYENGGGNSLLNKMRILVACEESQAVTIEIRKLGHEAYSCDIIECSGGHPEWHLQQDVTDLLKEKWDMILAFPPCTYLTVTGNRWFNAEKYGDKAIKRMQDREEAVKFFMMFANADCKKIAIENPVGIMSTEWRKPDQIIQPYEFGDPYEKKTCLWLKGLPKLVPTDIVEAPPRTQFKSGKTMALWYSEAFKLPKEERARVRSKTFPGIAKAMAKQWTR